MMLTEVFIVLRHAGRAVSIAGVFATERLADEFMAQVDGINGALSLEIHQVQS